ncbi:MAG: hypothetical protein MJZ28_05645 [Paludibacteraceae bacterium]|nr:hypothetical protein [Paludibacteraceae bacterium]
MRQSYKGFAWRLDNLKEVCNTFATDILGDFETFVALHEEKGIMDVVVRYILDENTFGYAQMGDFFFLDDCMYVISDDEKFKDIHNEEIPAIAADLHNSGWYRSERYVTRVIYAGVRTPFKDDKGDWIYTGDMVCANGDIISGVCAFPPYNDSYDIDIPNNYGLMLDNCMLPLRDCRKIERLGTIFFMLDNNDTEVNIEQIISSSVQQGTFDEEFMLCAKFTPSYQKEFWKYIALKEIGAEYNWRR